MLLQILGIFDIYYIYIPFSTSASLSSSASLSLSLSLVPSTFIMCIVNKYPSARTLTSTFSFPFSSSPNYGDERCSVRSQQKSSSSLVALVVVREDGDDVMVDNLQNFTKYITYRREFLGTTGSNDRIIIIIIPVATVATATVVAPTRHTSNSMTLLLLFKRSSGGAEYYQTIHSIAAAAAAATTTAGPVVVGGGVTLTVVFEIFFAVRSTNHSGFCFLWTVLFSCVCVCVCVVSDFWLS